ncbi:unnamed protein product [Amoebophrya sp. A25]|nr:unnamed protein product [Amoebophrya sp. A25]|eukprot:GSA25T00020178001.1
MGILRAQPCHVKQTCNPRCLGTTSFRSFLLGPQIATGVWGLNRSPSRYYRRRSGIPHSIWLESQPQSLHHRFIVWRSVATTSAKGARMVQYSTDEHETRGVSSPPVEAVPPVLGFRSLLSPEQQNDPYFAPALDPSAVVPFVAPDPLPDYEAFCTRFFRQNMFTMKMGLSNIEQALLLEGNPHLQHRRIFVGGTNGKGTVSAALSNILRAQGLKVGFFSSPHITDFRERFRINGVPVEQDVVHRIGVEVMVKFGGTGTDFNAECSAINPSTTSTDANSVNDGSTRAVSSTGGEVHPEVAHALGNGNRPVLTFFELATVMATKIFAAEKVDVAVYEIGLGGRLDAVNGLRPPDLCVFTTMGFDHTKYLGNSIEEIAFEKFSVIPRHARAVLGEQEYVDGTMDVWHRFLRERRVGHAVSIADLLRDLNETNESVAGKKEAGYLLDPVVVENFFTGRERMAEYLGKSWLDEHYARHLRTAIVSARLLLGDCGSSQKVSALSTEAISRGLKALHWPGRMESITWRGQHFLLDAAHNIDGIRLLTSAVEKRGLRIDAVLFGVMRDKDFVKMLSHLRSAFGEETAESSRPDVPFFGCEIDFPRAAKRADYEEVVGTSFFRTCGPSAKLLDEVLTVVTQQTSGGTNHERAAIIGQKDLKTAPDGSNAVGSVPEEQEKFSTEQLSPSGTSGCSTAADSPGCNRIAAQVEAKPVSGRPGTVLICGSIYLLGEIFRHMGADAGSIWRE